MRVISIRIVNNTADPRYQIEPRAESGNGSEQGNI